MSELSHPESKVVGHTPDNCPFCKRFAAHDYDADRYEFFGHKVVTYKNIKESMPGHRLFVPEMHEGQMTRDPVLLGATTAAAAQWASEHDFWNFNLIVSQGGYATQSVLHLHVHLTPRGVDDTLPTGWPWRGLMRNHGMSLVWTPETVVVS